MDNLNNRERLVKQYGNWIRVIEQPKHNPSKKRNCKANLINKDKLRNSCARSMFKIIAIALNNKWDWYGTMMLSKEAIADFNVAYDYIKKLVLRLRKIRERSETKNLAYLIVPDYAEQGGNKEWFIHIYLLNFPNTEKVFSQDLIVDKKIVYHWSKYEKLNGKTELYKIYDSGYTTNGKYKEEIVRQFYNVIERTGKEIGKGTSLYYCSDNVIRDVVIATGSPNEVEIKKTSYGNNFIKSMWFTSKNLQNNLLQAEKYLTSYHINENSDNYLGCSCVESSFDDSFYELPCEYDFMDFQQEEYVPQIHDYDVLNDLYESDESIDNTTIDVPHFLYCDKENNIDSK